MRRSPVCRPPAPWPSAAMRFTSAPKATRSMASLWQVGLPCGPRPGSSRPTASLAWGTDSMLLRATASRLSRPCLAADWPTEPTCRSGCRTKPTTACAYIRRARRSAVHFDRLTVQHLPARGSAGDDHQHQPKRWGPPAHGLGHPQLGRLRLEWRHHVFHRQWRDRMGDDTRDELNELQPGAFYGFPYFGGRVRLRASRRRLRPRHNPHPRMSSRPMSPRSGFTSIAVPCFRSCAAKR